MQALVMNKIFLGFLSGMAYIISIAKFFFSWKLPFHMSIQFAWLQIQKSMPRMLMFLSTLFKLLRPSYTFICKYACANLIKA